MIQLEKSKYERLKKSGISVVVSDTGMCNYLLWLLYIFVSTLLSNS